MTPARVTLFLGHYGSGKTNLAVNYAVWLRSQFPKVVIADLDIVNPYFRTADSAAWLRQKDIGLIASDFANTNLEAPALPSAAVSLFDDLSVHGVIDVGGDDRGAYAIGKYADKINGSAVLLVCNMYRPLSRTAADVRRVKQEIEKAAHIRFTGLVNNSNLGAQTTAEDVLASADYAREVSELCGLTLTMTGVRRDLITALEGRMPDLFGLDIVQAEKWRL